MDRLDRLLGPAVPLLRRVDDILAVAGAPADHEVWGFLRRVRLLPSDAVEAVAALRPAELADAAPELRADARSYAGLAESLPPPGSWSGEAAEAYDASRRHAADTLSGTPQSLDRRLEATADLADALIEWMEHTRGSLALTLAEVLTSSEALVLAAEPPPDPVTPRNTRAAADVAARVLETVAGSYAAVSRLMTDSADLVIPVRI